ncbi:RING-H2 finger protein ATL56 [Lactuca sativa]|uniref:RING-H2 finger protein ATL56 n=1 Tax=Lactuca sativa TaxID=4236 RepID=UPI000CB5E63D|nr:RING-H2 finger protein ATL56 [Lactuca sativa]
MPNTNRYRYSDTRINHATVSNHSPPKRNPKLLTIFLKFMVMSLILSLFLIFLGLAAILLLHILIFGSFLQRRRQHTTPPPASSYSFLHLQNNLPSFQYSSAAAASTDCSICLECFNEGDLCRKLPVCNHIFHAHCVDSWLMKVPTCPVCRTPVRLEVDRSSDLIVSDDDCKFFWAIGVGSG